MQILHLNSARPATPAGVRRIYRLTPLPPTSPDSPFPTGAVLNIVLLAPGDFLHDVALSSIVFPEGPFYMSLS